MKRLLIFEDYRLLFSFLKITYCSVFLTHTNIGINCEFDWKLNKLVLTI
jgi:hypothetical protein